MKDKKIVGGGTFSICDVSSEEVFIPQDFTNTNAINNFTKELCDDTVLS